MTQAQDLPTEVDRINGKLGNDPSTSPREQVRQMFSGGFGAGLVLIVLPCAGLYFGIERLNHSPSIGLPILTIFGIMILFGAASLVSTLFARLNLSDRDQALALPQGSIRAAIALLLVVLFAIISIMLYKDMDRPYVIYGLNSTQMQKLSEDLGTRLLAVVEDCRLSDPPQGNCPDDQRSYSVHAAQPPQQASNDLAKQLLILIGTLMTSVTSFYFASRANEAGAREAAQPPHAADPQPAAAAQPETDPHEHVDSCDLQITEPTPDHELPAAKGGVAS